MSIQSNISFQNEGVSSQLKNDVSEKHFFFPKAAHPEDIPLIEAYDEQSLGDMCPSDGIYHIEDF